VVEGSGAGAEGLLDRVQAVQNIHSVSVIGMEGGESLGRGLMAEDEAGGAAVGA
jgi:hypothetical protein